MKLVKLKYLGYKFSKILYKDYWHLPVILITGYLYLSQVFQFIKLHPQFYYYWDWPGHIDKSLKLGWLPWQTGWDTSFWGGFPTLTYPMFSHYILKIITFFVSKTPQNLILFIVLISILQLISYYLVSRKYANHSKLTTCLIFIGLTLTTLYAHGSFLGSYNGLLITGGFPAAIATTLFMFYLYSEKIYYKAILFGLIILTHTLTAIVVVIIILFHTFYHTVMLITDKSNKKDHIKQILGRIYTIAIGALIGLPWILAYLDPSFGNTAINAPGDPSQLTLILVLILLIIILEKYHSNSFIFSTFFIGLLCLIPFWLMHKFELFIPLRGIHFYRFGWYFQLLSVVFVLSTFSIFFQKFKKPTKIIFIVVFILVIYLFPINGQGETITYNLPNFSEKSFRVIDVSSIYAVPNYPHTTEHIMSDITSIPASIGLFYESAKLGLIFYDFANSLNPYVFKNGTYESYYNNQSTHPYRKLNQINDANLLGIRYDTFTTDENVASKSPNLKIIGTIIPTNNSNDLKQNNIYLEQLNDTSLIESLSQLPEVGEVKIGNWWVNTNHNRLIVNEATPIENKSLDLSMPIINDVQINPQQLQFNINSAKFTPVLIKFTHNKYWHIISNPENILTKSPILITPGFMFIIAKGQVTLAWDTPPYIKYSWFISLITLLTCLILAIKNKGGTKLIVPP